jgi:hypothetical protein
MISWALIVFGVTLVVTFSKIAAPIRRLWPTFLHCPLCVGWWVGLGLGLLHLGPAPTTLPMAPVADAFASSALCWSWHVILIRLGADRL